MIQTVPLKKILPIFVAALLLLVGCTYDISNRECYRSIVNNTVCLKYAMKLWLPAKGNSKFSSYPYVLVDQDFSTSAWNSHGESIQDGSIAALIPAGTSLHIDKVVDYKALDDAHSDALGTAYVPVLGGEVHFDYECNAFSSMPWVLKQTQ